MNREERLRRACEEIATHVAHGRLNAVENLLAQQPDWSQDDESLMELIYAEIVAREDCDLPVMRHEFTDRFPQVAPRIVALLQLHHQADVPLRHIGSFELLEPMGEGERGIVYRARQVGLNRFVAIKLMKQSWLGQERRQRFMLQAKAVASLQHPAIVQIIEVGEASGDSGEAEMVPYIVMELLSGGTLADRLSTASWSARQIAEVLLVLSQGLQTAHAQGVFHGDIKPSNIVFTSDGCPKLVDFNALTCWDDLRSDVRDDQTLLNGTLAYAAPEQFVSADSPVVDGRVDVYGLGVLLYECLTGGPPFQGTHRWDTLRRIQTEAPVAPRRLRPGMPHDLETICLHCLEKDPLQRYQTLPELSADLQRFLEGRPIAAKPASRSQRLRKWMVRNPIMAGLATISLAALLIGSVAVVAGWQQARYHAATIVEVLQQQRAAASSQQTALAQYLLAAHDPYRAERILSETQKELRDWEWYYLNSRCHPEAWRYQGHQYAITDVAIDEESRWLYSVSAQLEGRRAGELCLWDLKQGQLTQRLSRDYPFTGVGWSAVRHRLAAVSSGKSDQDGRLELFQSAHGTLRWQTTDQFPPTSEASRYLDVDWSEDGEWLATAGHDGLIRLWDATTGELQQTCTGHTAPVGCVKFSADGTRLLSASRDASVRLWQVPTGTPIAKYATQVPMHGVDFHPQGTQIYACGEGGLVQTWWLGLTLFSNHRHIRLRAENAAALLCTRDGETLVIGDSQGKLHQWKSDLSEPLPLLGSHQQAITALATSHHGRYVASAGGRDLKVWDMRAKPNPLVITSRGGGASALAWGNDAQTLVVALQPTPTRRTPLQLQTVNVVSGKMTHLVDVPSPVTDLVRHPVTADLAWTCQDGSVHLYDLLQRKFRVQTKAHAGPALGIAGTPAGDAWISVGADGQICRWQMQTKQPVDRAYVSGKRPLQSVVCLKNQAIVAADDQGNLWRWDMDQEPQSIVRLPQSVTRLAYHAPTDALAAACGRDLYLWQDFSRVLPLSHAASWSEPPRPFSSELEPIHDLQFSPQGTRLVALSRDAMLRMWDVSSRREVFAQSNPENVPGRVLFDPTGRYLVSMAATRLEIYDARHAFSPWALRYPASDPAP